MLSNISGFAAQKLNKPPAKKYNSVLYSVSTELEFYFLPCFDLL